MYERRGTLSPEELADLFIRAWGTDKSGYEDVLARSFTWVTARDGASLVGFVNVAWDGGVHFFLLDTTVDPDHQRRGVGLAVIRAAIDACRGNGHWLHVDADAELMERLYLRVGFGRTSASITNLQRGSRPVLP